jgi:hypothetical protein
VCMSALKGERQYGGGVDRNIQDHPDAADF